MVLSVKLELGLDQNRIEFIQYLEKETDRVMEANGFTRTTTTKSKDLVEFTYRQLWKDI